VKERTVDGIKMLVVPIDPLDAIDLGNELLAHLAPGIAATALGEKTLGRFAALEGLGMTANALIGKLGDMLPRLLAGTTAVAGGEKYSLSKGKEEVNRLLTAHPLALKPVIAFSAEVQFARFFPESVLSAIKARMRNLSEGFSQSTSDTGSSTG
jgi:hypothetical protein